MRVNCKKDGEYCTVRLHRYTLDFTCRRETTDFTVVDIAQTVKQNTVFFDRDQIQIQPLWDPVHQPLRRGVGGVGDGGNTVHEK